MHASFVGQAQRCVWEGGHLVALLRGMGASRELQLRVKADVLVVQFLEWCVARVSVSHSSPRTPLIFFHYFALFEKAPFCQPLIFPFPIFLPPFLPRRAALYRVLNSDSFIFMVGLREVISSRVADVYDLVVAKGCLEADSALPLGAVLDLLHVVVLTAAHFFHANCTELDAQLRQVSREVEQALVPGARTPLPPAPSLAASAASWQ